MSTVTNEAKPSKKKRARQIKPPQQEIDRSSLGFRFRKSWRAIFFVFFVVFLHPEIVPFFNTDIVQFVAGVLTLFPLSTFIEVVTEDLIERLGQFVGGLMHAFFSNVAYMVLTITTLIVASHKPEVQADLVTVVQSSIAGTIVIDILFILGIAILIGGFRNGRMKFDPEKSNAYAEMLTVAIVALALPSLAYFLGIQLGINTPKLTISASETSILSNITAIILIIAYIGYLGWFVFHIRDKEAIPESPAESVTESFRGDLIGVLAENVAKEEEQEQQHELQAMMNTPTMKRGDADNVPTHTEIARHVQEKHQEIRHNKSKHQLTSAERKKRWHLWELELWEVGILILGTAGVVFISEGMARGIENGFLIKGSGLNTFFVGFIVLPLASNMVEISAAVSTAWHDRMETCLAITAGSAIQVALLVAPVLVLVGHIVGLESMNLIFGIFLLGIFALVAYLFQIITVDGETTWLEGLQLTSFFAVLVAVALFAGSPR